jgi:hypothetical protein
MGSIECSKHMGSAPPSRTTSDNQDENAPGSPRHFIAALASDSRVCLGIPHAHHERRHVVARRAHSRVAGALTDCFASRERRHHLCESCRRQSDSHKLATAAFFEVPLS